MMARSIHALHARDDLAELRVAKAWQSVPWAPPAVDVDLNDLTDGKGAWAPEEMERGMAEHWMGYRRA